MSLEDIFMLICGIFIVICNVIEDADKTGWQWPQNKGEL